MDFEDFGMIEILRVFVGLENFSLLKQSQNISSKKLFNNLTTYHFLPPRAKTPKQRINK